MNNTVIDIHMINNKGFIWNANDWYTLRTKYRLLGNLIGTSPNSTCHNENGLPSVLLPEEVRFIIENNIGRTVGYSELTSLPTEYNPTNSEQVIELKKEVNVNQPETPVHTLTQLDELFSNVIEVPLAEMMGDLERIRYKVFKDLWFKGYYLTCGMKFGGDFLVYEGDPLAYHAKYIINCRDLDKKVMVSRSRIGIITRKNMVLATVDGDSVNYLIYSMDHSTKVIKKKPLHFVLCK